MLVCAVRMCGVYKEVCMSVGTERGTHKAPVPWGSVLALKEVMSISVGASICLSLTGAAKTEVAPKSRRDDRAAMVFIFIIRWMISLLVLD